MSYQPLPTQRVKRLHSPRRATVSVVVPCYNYARYLSACVESALSQQGVDINVIIVDDASSDASLDVAREMANRDARVSVLANRVNAGPVDTFNRGLAMAEGEFLVRLDADDLLTPGSLSRAVAVMQAHPSVGLVYGHPIHFSGEDLPPARTESTGWLRWRGTDWLAARCADGSNVITSPEAVMRRSVVDVVGGQRRLAHTHDMEMWLRIAAHSDVAYVLGADQAWHRDHADSLSNEVAEPDLLLAEVRAAFIELFEGLGTVSAPHKELDSKWRRAVALDALAGALNRLDRGEWSETCSRLQEFALEVDPSVRETRQWRRLSRRAGSAGPLAIVLGVPSRARGRLRFEIRCHRWQRTGVYEALRVNSVGTG